MRAYADLNTCRAIGMSVGPIPWTAVDAYCERKGIRGTARLTLEVCVAALDRHDLAEMQAKLRPQEAGHGR